MSVETNKALARRFVEEHNGENYLAVHDELLAPSVAIHFAAPGMPPLMDREGHKQLIAGFRAALPDVRDAVEDVIGEGDRVAVRWTGAGTHTGAELMGIPAAGKAISVGGMYIFRFADGKITESWMTFDALGLLQQLGAIPV